MGWQPAYGLFVGFPYLAVGFVTGQCSGTVGKPLGVVTSLWTEAGPMTNSSSA